MFVSPENESISLPLDGAKVSSLKSLSPMGSNPDSLHGLSPPSELPDSPPLPAVFTDVNVIPEHEKSELEQSIACLDGEIAQLRQKQGSSDKKRREALNKILDIKGIIRVFCRVRPVLLTNRRKIGEPIMSESEKIVIRSPGSRKEFGFDKVFHQETSQEEVFVEVEPILRSALDGHNVCIFAYGQTGTGKTFTMDGTSDQPGIVPRAIEELFRLVLLDGSSCVTFSMSMLEVYMGNLRDLLDSKRACRADEPVTRCNLNIQTDPKGLVEIEGLTEVQIPDFAKARWWYSKGRRVRSTSWTNVNEASSRSHCLTRVTIFRHEVGSEAKAEMSKLWLVDLGGSERLLKTGATGQTLDEGRAINLSLSALGDVIAALRRKRGHVPYRNSKLTQILKDSLGDGSKVLMLVHISPCEEDVGETICSLSFAKRARAIESSRELPEDLKKEREKRTAQLEEDMKEAEEECRNVGNQIRKVELLLSEKKTLVASAYQVLAEDEKTPSNPKENYKEVNKTPQVNDKGLQRTIPGSLPRFMTSTVASRQRKSSAEREIVRRSRSLRSGTRSSIQFSASQSFSYSDHRLRAILRNSIKKSRYGETKTLPTESPRCNNSDLKTASLPQRKMVTSSDPNLIVTLCRHRRRMSDLI